MEIRSGLTDLYSGDTESLRNSLIGNIKGSTEKESNLLGYLGGTGIEIGGGYVTDLATAGLLNPATIVATGGWSILGYGLANFTSGASTNIAAQKLRGEEEIGWGEVFSSGLIDLIPFWGQKLKGAKGITNIAFQSGARTVAQRQGEVALDDQRWLTPKEMLEAAALGGAFGAGFKGAGEGFNLLRGKYAKYDLEEARELFPPEVIQELINKDRIHKVPKFARYYAAQRNIDSINGEDSFWAPLKRLQESTDPKDQSKYTEITEFLEGKVTKGGKRTGGYYKREEANIELMNIADKAFAAGQTVEGYRTVAGFLPLKDRVYPSGNKELGLISIAKKHGYTIEDVHKYIVDQEEGNKYLHILIKELNEFNSNKQVKILDELSQLKTRMGEAGFRTSQPWYQTYLKLRKYAKLNKYEFGHKESLWKMWINELSGGNRVSNTYAQSRGNWFYTDFYGKKHRIQGNRSLGSKGDPPTFTLIKLQGSSANLEDDFVKYMMPMRENTSIPDEYMEMADILYRKSMSEVELNLNKKLSNEEYYAEVSRYSMAITQALHILFKKADDIELPDWILEDDLLLKIPAKQIWAGLDPTDRAEQVSLKNLQKKFKQLKLLYKSTLETILENT